MSSSAQRSPGWAEKEVGTVRKPVGRGKANTKSAFVLLVLLVLFVPFVLLCPHGGKDKKDTRDEKDNPGFHIPLAKTRIVLTGIGLSLRIRRPSAKKRISLESLHYGQAVNADQPIRVLSHALGSVSCSMHELCSER
jgi:hypothetical protein